MQPSSRLHRPCTLTRRHFLAQNSLGIGGLALAWLLNEDRVRAAPTRPELEERRFDLTPKQPHFAPRATAMISLFMQGGPSHVDLLDPKPGWPGSTASRFPANQFDNAAEASAKLLASPWQFRPPRPVRHRMSELLPHLGEHRRRHLRRPLDAHRRQQSRTSRSALSRADPGVAGRRSAAWLTYGLGCESQKLPAYVVLTDPGGMPVEGVGNWSNGWLPSSFKGTVLRAQEPRILNLDPPAGMRGQPQERYLASWSRSTASTCGSGIRAKPIWRPASPATSWPRKMQSAAKEALDISAGKPRPRTALRPGRCRRPASTAPAA